MYEEILNKREEIVTNLVSEISTEINEDMGALQEMIDLSLANMSSGRKLLELVVEELGKFKHRTSNKVNRLSLDIMESL